VDGVGKYGTDKTTYRTTALPARGVKLNFVPGGWGSHIRNPKAKTYKTLAERTSGVKLNFVPGGWCW